MPSPDLLLGLVGRGIQESRTPSMHSEEGRAQGINVLYQLLDADQLPRGEQALPSIIDAAELCGFAGLNITFPYKVEVMQLLDELAPGAQAVGAVNTVVFRDGKRTGHNTDKWGFEENVRQHLRGAKRDHVLLLGTGGAGAAVAQALVSLGVSHLTLADSNPNSASLLRDRLRQTAPQITVPSVDPKQLSAINADGIVNATPMGMDKLPGSAYPLAALDPACWVADIVYFPLETQLLAAARATGCRVLPGSGMAIYQAVRAFELFSGLQADVKRMKTTFDSF